MDKSKILANAEFRDLFLCRNSKVAVYWKTRKDDNGSVYHYLITDDGMLLYYDNGININNLTEYDIIDVYMDRADYEDGFDDGFDAGCWKANKETNTELKAKAIQKLFDCQENTDTEVAHGDADDTLCELLVDLGFKEVVDEYNNVHKWYA